MKNKADVARIDQAIHRIPHLPFLEVRTTASSARAYAAHFHDTLSLGVILKGMTLTRCDGEETMLGAGGMVLIAPGEVHSCNPVNGQSRGYHMFFIDTAWALAQLGQPANRRLRVIDRTPKGKKTFSELSALADALYSGKCDEAQCGVLSSIIESCCEAIPDNEMHPFPDDLAVADTAKRLGVRRETFIRTFRRATGMTPGSYRQCLRLLRAQRLLRRGNGIANVALECGFTDQSHLHRMCVKYFAATPKQMTPRNLAKRSLSSKK